MGKEYYQNNRDKILKRCREYYLNNKDKIKEYRKEYDKQYNIKNRDKLRKKNKKHYLKNKDKFSKQHKEYYYNNKDKILKRHKKYHLRNPRYAKEYRLNNKPKINLRDRNRRLYDKNYSITTRLRNLFRKALIRYTTTGKYQPSNEYSIDYKSIIEHLKPFPEDIFLFHIDHIKPLCKFNFLNKDGSANLEEIKKAFEPSNHQWLLAENNQSKGGKF